MKSRGQPTTSHQPPELPEEIEEIADDPVVSEPVEAVSAENPWRSIEDAPKDRTIEGRFSQDEEVGRPIGWRFSRRRVGHQWVDGGVWYAAETAGAVQLHPIEWREWQQIAIRFDERGQPPVAA
jgi:hypothetical protein